MLESNEIVLTDGANAKKRKIEDIVFEEKVCVVCMSDPSNIKFMPCRHLCLCYDCFKYMNKPESKCPICRCAIGHIVTDPETEHRLKVFARQRQHQQEQQQLFLLLRHASKCNRHGDCRVTPHCASTTTLWRHVMSCKDRGCSSANCAASKYVLSHYSKCRELGCSFCEPVRDAIKRNCIIILED